MPSRSAVPARCSGSVCRSPVRFSLTKKSRDRVHIPHAPSKNKTPLTASLSTRRDVRRQVGYRLAGRCDRTDPQGGLSRVTRRAVNRRSRHPDSRGDGGEQRKPGSLYAVDRSVSRKLGEDPASGVDQPGTGLDSSVITSPPLGRGVGDHPVRRGPAESEQHRPEGLGGRQGFGAGTPDAPGLTGQEEPRPRDHPAGPLRRGRARVVSRCNAGQADPRAGAPGLGASGLASRRRAAMPASASRTTRCAAFTVSSAWS